MDCRIAGWFSMKADMRITMSDSGKGALKHSCLPDLVLDKLMEWIMEGKLMMGDKLNTEELANQLGVSRMPIREALSTLAKKGLAESIPYAGTRLVVLTQEDVRQIYIARKALESVVARYACEKITEEGLERLEEIHEKYQKVVRKEKLDAVEVYQQNRLFHFSIYKESGLNRLCTMIESLWDNLSFFKLVYGQKLLDATESKERLIAEHQSYLEALKAHDGVKLEKLVGANLQKRIDDIPYNFEAYSRE